MSQHFLVEVQDAAGKIHLWLPGKVEPDLLTYYPPAREALLLPPPSVVHSRPGPRREREG